MSRTTILFLLLFFVGAASADSEPFSFKSDTLGDSLETFKERHHEVVGDTIKRTMPACSDEPHHPAMLLTQDWYEEAGLINCRLHLPFHYTRDGVPRPTVGGIDTEMLLYRFVDGQLFKIMAIIGRDKFGELRGAVNQRYGEPSAQEAVQYSNLFGAEFDGVVEHWCREQTCLSLVERFAGNDQSALIYFHKDLVEIADAKDGSSDSSDF